MNNNLKFVGPLKGAALEVIEKFEKKYKFRLPDDYRSFAEKFSGSEFENTCYYKVKDGEEERYEGICLFLSFILLGEESNGDSIEGEMENVDEFPKERLVPIACGGSVNFACLDYKYEKPKISFWHFEVEEPVLIANSFTDFLDMLKTEEEIFPGIWDD